MGDRGLQTSVWATKFSEEAQYTRRPGDWTCPSCGFSNFQRRTECFRCSFTPTPTSAGFRDDAIERNGYGLPDMMPPPQRMVPESGIGGHEKIRGGFQAHITPGLIDNRIQHIPKVNNERNGLYTSRWAPRNSSGRPKISDGEEVWTKVCLRSPGSGQ
jgi:hypothetical protein